MVRKGTGVVVVVRVEIQVGRIRSVVCGHRAHLSHDVPLILWWVKTH